MISNISMLSGSILLAMSGLSQAAITQDVSNEEVELNNISYHVADTTELADNEVNIIFIRPLDNDGLQTVANIGIDGRFQASLQPGHYSKIKYCSGKHNISIGPTALKTNDFTHPYSTLVYFTAPQNHYLFVEIDDSTGEPKLSKLAPAYAQRLLSSLSEQNNKISRVVVNCPPVVEPEPVIEVEVDKSINLEVLFEFDKAVVQPEFNPRIEAVANFMTKHTNTNSIIEGHTDSVGRDSYNLKLSELRAEAVKQQLVNKYGIEAHRIQTQGFGETRPVDTNDTPEGRYNNRRVVTIVSVNK